MAILMLSPEVLGCHCPSDFLERHNRPPVSISKIPWNNSIELFQGTTGLDGGRDTQPRLRFRRWRGTERRCAMGTSHVAGTATDAPQEKPPPSTSVETPDCLIGMIVSSSEDSPPVNRLVKKSVMGVMREEVNEAISAV